MYLTAHRVWSRTHQREAVHAFLYRHPTPLTTPVDVALVADQEPGELEASHVELAAGGNEVRSYLDIAAVREPSGSELAEILDRLVEVVRATDAPTARSEADDVASRFYANPALIPSRVEEVLALGAALRRLYEASRSKPPLVVHVDDEDKGRAIRLSLDLDSANRIRELLGPDWQIPPSLSIDRGMWTDFEARRGPIFHHLLAVLTGLDAPQIEAIGGVRVMPKPGREIA
jgi:hypothetical protein